MAQLKVFFSYFRKYNVNTKIIITRFVLTNILYLRGLSIVDRRTVVKVYCQYERERSRLSNQIEAGGSCELRTTSHPRSQSYSFHRFDHLPLQPRDFLSKLLRDDARVSPREPVSRA